MVGGFQSLHVVHDLRGLATHTHIKFVQKRSLAAWGVRVAEWLSHSAVVPEVPGSNPGDAESVGE